MNDPALMDDARPSQHPEAFRFLLPVRYVEVDRQGVVFNAHYLTYLDLAITAYWNASGIPYALLVLEECDWRVKKALITWSAPASFGDTLAIDIRTPRLGRSSVVFAAEIKRASDMALIADAEVTCVIVEANSGKSMSLPKRIRESIVPGPMGATATEVGELHGR